MNGNVKEYAMKTLVGVATASLIAGGGFAFKINNRVTVMETRLESMAYDLHEIKIDIKDLPRGDGGLSENERRRMAQIEEDISCIRGLLSGQTRCPPR